MKKPLFFIISLTTLLCLFTACSKDKDEPESVQRVIPFFEWPNEEPFVYNMTCQINAEAQTLTVVAHSNMDKVELNYSVDAVWIEFKEMIKKPEVEQIEFVFNIYPNISGSERTGYVFFSYPPGTEEHLLIYTRSLTVIQAADNP